MGPVSHLERGVSPICSDTCGKASDCLATIDFQAQLPGNSTICAKDFTIFTIENECQMAFAVHGSKTTCISQGRWTELAREIFNACMNNPKVGFGGYRSYMS
jgi:hypothetical protein